MGPLDGIFTWLAARLWISRTCASPRWRMACILELAALSAAPAMGVKASSISCIRQTVDKEVIAVGSFL